MPLFDFLCSACQHSFEELVSAGERPACPECDSRKVQRQLPVFAVNAGGEAPMPAGPGGCGSCGDPRGPGACSMN